MKFKKISSKWEEKIKSFLRFFHLKAAAVFFPLVGILLSLIVSALFIEMADISAIKAYGYLLQGAFGDVYNLGNSLIRATPLLFSALAVAVAFRANFFNIGAEGQLYMGALLATAVGIGLGKMPVIDMIIVILSGMIGGAIWGFFPALLKAILGINEVIVTIMMNYIAIYTVNYFVAGPLNDSITLFPQSLPIADTAKLPVIIQGTSIHGGVMLGILMVFLVYILLSKTTLGYKLKAVGKNQKAARICGINVPLTIILTMLISGALAGLGGVVEIMGVYGRLNEGFSPGYGYLGIPIALIGRNEPLGIALTAILFGALLTGANSMQSGAGVPASLIYVIQGLAVLFMLGGMSLQNHLRKKQA